MAFTVEDGSGNPTANSYGDEAEFNTHHTDRAQIDAGEFTTAEIEASLILATDYIEKRFGRRFRGWRRSQSQALQWPRIDAFDNADFLFDGVPRQLKLALFEYTWIVLKLERNLAPIPGLVFGTIDPETGETTTLVSGRVTREKKKIGPIEKDVTAEASEGFNAAPTAKMSVTVGMIPEYPQADLWIEELLRSSKSRTLVRA